ncbi:hypothetical protein IE077_004414 [Cardiosporidium cionae]|uniref:Uncharacterized protein n=1 Tax=Cardiosporidium cionae TaxID=476202 RepID=A0ABQ7JFH2_9APIC|nr:hypothetical protein IE077_004414 [Cardiosporidium cionae]|eukprot:KAF8822772.1 hypothetical protein IE077_004414 [Cardiosporidium cionae]
MKVPLKKVYFYRHYERLLQNTESYDKLKMENMNLKTIRALDEFPVGVFEGELTLVEQNIIDRTLMHCSESAFQNFCGNIKQSQKYMKESRMFAFFSNEMTKRLKIQQEADEILQTNILEHKRKVEEWMESFSALIKTLSLHYDKLKETFFEALEKLNHMELHPALMTSTQKTLAEINWIIEEDSLLSCLNEIKFISENQEKSFDALLHVLPAPPMTFSSYSVCQRLQIESSQKSALTEILKAHEQLEYKKNFIQQQWEIAFLHTLQRISTYFSFKTRLKKIHDIGVIYRASFLQLEEAATLLDRIYKFPSTYIFSLEEVIRRRKFHQIYFETASVAKEGLHSMCQAEIRKRIEVLSPPSVVFEIPDLECSLPPISSATLPSSSNEFHHL